MYARRDILEATYRIRVGDGYGTAFCVNKNGRFYFVTAKHMFEKSGGIGEGGCISNFTIVNRIDGRFMSLNGVRVYFAEDGCDIAVLEVPGADELRWIDYTVLTDAGITLGEDVLLVGFPFVFDGGYRVPNSDGASPFYLPIVKAGIVSTFENNYTRAFLVDAHNNGGFSGGPVVMRCGSNGSIVCGVISGFLNDKYKNQPEGVVNSGFTTVSPIKYAAALIDVM